MSLKPHPDRLFPVDSITRDVARQIYSKIKDLPIVSPHGHTDPHWFAKNDPFQNATELFLRPDHYVFRMLYSQGISLESLGIGEKELNEKEQRATWKLFAENFYLFRGTPTWMWFEYVFYEVFELNKKFNGENADYFFDSINELLKTKEFLPRALFERFNIEVIATTDDPTDSLAPHQSILDSGWKGSVIPCFRPDKVVDPEHEDFVNSIEKLAEITGEDTQHFSGYLQALRNRRLFFKKMGATSTDHGHPDPYTCELSKVEVEKLYSKCLLGDINHSEARAFRGHMLMEMAQMSLEDGLVMQLHPGSFRNHNLSLFQKFGRDKGHDIPVRAEFTQNLKALLNKYGNEKDFTFIIFTLDESVYSRELAPLAGHYPALKLGPSWWFHDSPEGMRRFRESVTETAGFYNTVGFNDDTRAFLSIPARHDMARRMDSSFLARLVCEHRISLEDAHTVAYDLTYNLVKKNYKL